MRYAEVANKIWEHVYQALRIELPLEYVDSSAWQHRSVGEYRHK
jgi:hypothetical protein